MKTKRERRSAAGRRPPHVVAELGTVAERLRELADTPPSDVTADERRRRFQADLMRLHRLACRFWGAGESAALRVRHAELKSEIVRLLRDSTPSGLTSDWTRRLRRLLDRMSGQVAGETHAALRRSLEDLGGGD